eukprot:11468158-Alexandrium_andersonii.AAC.1
MLLLLAIALEIMRSLRWPSCADAVMDHYADPWADTSADTSSENISFISTLFSANPELHATSAAWDRWGGPWG